MRELRQSLRVFAGAAVAVVVAGVVAMASHQPWLFPSLGPAVMLHVEKPESAESSPRSTLIGHAVALLAGYGCLVVGGLTGHPSVLQEGVTGPRIVAAAGSSLAVTALVLLLLDAPHPPAGATTLIVSLGLLRTPTQLVIAAGAVVLVTVVDWVFNRATGRAMPVWAPPTPRPEGASRG
jgi:CBS-domain-containing membrane protein